MPTTIGGTSFFTPAELTGQLGIGTDYIRRLLEQGRFPGAIRPHPRCWLVPASAVEQYKLTRRPSGSPRGVGSNSKLAIIIPPENIE